MERKSVGITTLILIIVTIMFLDLQSAGATPTTPNDYHYLANPYDTFVTCNDSITWKAYGYWADPLAWGELQKCDGTGFVKSGVAKVVLVSTGQVVTQANYSVGDTRVILTFDPLRDYGIVGNQDYKIIIYPTGDVSKTTYPITIWAEIATSLEAKLNGSRLTSVRVCYGSPSTSCANGGAGYHKQYLPDGIGYWDFFVQKYAGCSSLQLTDNDPDDDASYSSYNSSWWRVVIPDVDTAVIANFICRGVTVTPGNINQTGTPGQVLTYTLRVTNTGNATDTFNVMLSGQTFGTTAPATVGPLGAGIGTNLNVVVTIPSGATNGATDAVATTLQSQADSTKQASATLTTVVNVPQTDVQIGQTSTPNPGVINALLTYTITVTNNGPATATGVRLTDTLPAGVVFSSASAGCTLGGSLVTCNIGSLTTGASVVAGIRVTPTATGLITNTAVVGMNASDLSPANNTTSATINVVAPIPSLALNQFTLSQSLFINQAFSQTLIISNTGPVGSILTWAITEAYGSLLTSLPILAQNQSAGESQVAQDSRRVNLQGVIPLVFASPNPQLPQFDLDEDFVNVEALPAYGWAIINHSEPVGGLSWFQGTNTLDTFPAQSGVPTSYVASNYEAVNNLGTISNWLLTPELELHNGAKFSFYTRVPAGSSYPDRLQVRLSTAGNSADVGMTAASVGVFNNLLLDINPVEVQGGYPETWTVYTLTITGLPNPTTGRVAFRYYLSSDAGASGTKANWIGIDTVQYRQPPADCATPTDMPWLTVSPSSGTTPSGSTTNVNITFNTTGLTPGESYTGKLCLVSNDPLQTLTQIPVTLTVTPTYGGIVLTGNQTVTAHVGQGVMYTFLITNTGNAPDTYLLELTNTPAFTTTVAPPNPIAPGASGPVYIRVDAPNVPEGTTSTANFRIKSQGSGRIIGYLTLITDAIWWRNYLPMIWK